MNFIHMLHMLEKQPSVHAVGMYFKKLIGKIKKLSELKIK
jgi:hypothetical protein